MATIYGIGLANLLFLPWANKLKIAVQNQAHIHEMSIEGLTLPGLALGTTERVVSLLTQIWLSLIV